MSTSRTPIFILPIDMFHAVFDFLSTTDRISFSSVSKDIRHTFLPRIFSKITLTSAFKQTLIPRVLEHSDPSLLAVVRHGALHLSCMQVSNINSSCLQFLPGLPNLESLELRHVPACHLKRILGYLRQSSIRRLLLSLEANDRPEPTTGLAGLQTLHVLWGQCLDSSKFILRPEFPDFMLTLLKPSASTLEDLRIEIAQPYDSPYTRFTLALLRFPMLRTLYFDMCTGDAAMVSLLPESMPILEELCLNLNAWDRPGHKDVFVQSFSRLGRLKRLSLIIDAEAELDDLVVLYGPLLPLPNLYQLNTSYSLWRQRFQKAHLRRTEHLASKCTGLQSVTWLQLRPHVGDVQLVTLSVVTDGTQVQGLRVKMIWDPWDVVSYQNAYPRKPLPAYVVEMDDAERSRLCGNRRWSL